MDSRLPHIVFVSGHHVSLFPILGNVQIGLVYSVCYAGNSPSVYLDIPIDCSSNLLPLMLSVVIIFDFFYVILLAVCASWLKMILFQLRVSCVRLFAYIMNVSNIWNYGKLNLHTIYKSDILSPDALRPSLPLASSTWWKRYNFMWVVSTSFFCIH